MRMIRLDGSAVGKRLGKTVLAADGRVLLHSGVVLTDNYLRRLLDKGYRSIYIEDEFAKNIVADDVVSEQTRIKAVQAVQETMEKYHNSLHFDSSKIKASVGSMIDELQGNHDLLAGLSTIRSFDNYTFAHSVNVCTLSLVLGISLYYDFDRLYELGVGAILHDIGKTQTPVTILNKETSLTDGEWDIIKKHTDFGFEILRQHFEISLLSSHIAYQHHERHDGSGYPRGLKGDGILEIARVSAIADVYDAITNDRIYRSRLPQHQAHNLMLRSIGTHFDGNLVRRFLDRLLVFPNGTLVKLNNGQVGIVARQEAKVNIRPVVRVLTDDRQKLLSKWPEIRLIERPEIEIREILEDYPFPTDGG